LTNSDKLYKLIDFAFYVITVIIIILISSFNALFLLAPPYAVTAYLIIFEHGGKFSKKKSVLFSYLFVIFSSEFIHLALGISPLYMTANVIIVSAFISFTGNNHPPAIALTIFSYIVHSTVYFALTSILVLLVIMILAYSMDYTKVLLNGRVN
jgi:hypothetical protein